MVSMLSLLRGVSDMKGLIIKQPWIDLIFDEHKDYELRSRNTWMRGRIALIRQGSGFIDGSATLVDCVGPLTDDELDALYNRHKVPSGHYGKWRYAWVLKDAKRYDKPIPYNHPQGAVIWVNLECLDK